ncbi:MAG: ABC transporter substrate-binding protein, partial [Candidatus Lustribacter sp.]
MVIARFVLVLLLAVVNVRSGDAQTMKLSVLLPPVDTAAEIFIAQDMGFFAKQGLDVQIEPGTNGSAIAAAVLFLVIAGVAGTQVSRERASALDDASREINLAAGEIARR